MEKNFFELLWHALNADLPEKEEAVLRLHEMAASGALQFEHATAVHPVPTPVYHKLCTVVRPCGVEKRSNLKSDLGKARFLHAIAHIEFSAIDLALDAAYRFRHLPQAYYLDWIEVAADEVRHFGMVKTLLGELGYRYGDFPVHGALWEACQKSLTLMERMAVVPRYLEAGGLDANPKMIARLERIGDDGAKKIVAALTVILHEEIDHVKKGDRWFRYACEKEGVESTIYMELIEKVLPGSTKPKRYLNKAARLEAGFSCRELNLLSDKSVCDE